MKFYRVTIRRPMFSGCGALQADLAHLSSKTSALKWAKKMAKLLDQDHKNYLVKIEELTLKELKLAVLIKAFNSEDIIDLVESQKTIEVFNP